MKNSVLNKLRKINEALLSRLKSKKEIIAERSERLDPNTSVKKVKPLLKDGTPDDGFEHRSSAGIANPA